MNAPPDLNTSEGRNAYRTDLRGIGRFARFLGFIVVIIGAGIVITAKSMDAPPDWILNTGWAVLGAGWLVLAYAMVQRTLYHRRRSAGRDRQGM